MKKRKKTTGRSQTKQKPFLPLDRRYDAADAASIDPSVLATFPYEDKGKPLHIVIDTDEFTAVCPWSGLPDFGTIRVEYVPGNVCIELRSFKYYLLSFRNVGIYQEHAANRILDDLITLSRPTWMRITVDYRIRGGVHTVVTREYRMKENPSSSS